MTYKEEAPVITTEEGVGKNDRTAYNHPAYGTVVLTHTQGGSGALFGSDIGHMGRIRIELNKAVMYRNINNDWIHSRETVAVFELSHSQFAEFITGVGKGDGTPCTLRYIREGDLVALPGISLVETKQELFKREIHDNTKNQLQDISDGLQAIQTMVDSGKVPMKELKAVLHNLKCSVGNMPGNMKFVVEMAEEALEKATANAKIEVEAFIGAKAKSLGLQSIQQLAQIGNDKE